MGEGGEIGDKVTLKSCTVGKRCKIGLKSKLNQCVIMQGVQIGDNCTIQNCIISDNAVIGNGCSLKHCYVGANVNLKDGSAIKSETISSSTITEQVTRLVCIPSMIHLASGLRRYCCPVQTCQILLHALGYCDYQMPDCSTNLSYLDVNHRKLFCISFITN